MITIYFTHEGYFVTGEGVDVSRRCSPALTSEGDPVFQRLHHTYKVLYLALKEISCVVVQEDIVVYGDNRLIDELNGVCPPLDGTHKKWLEVIRQHIIPDINGLVFFRKKPPQQVKSAIKGAHSGMLDQIDEHTLSEIAHKEKERQEQESAARKKRLVSNLKSKWFGDNYEQK
jgi:hypothetical protein